jgi:formylglycine-generating enzyme required for sulfatase activity
MMSVMATRKGKRVAITAGAIALVVIAVAVFLGWKHVVFYYRFEAIGKNAQGFREYRHRQTGIVMVLLPGGSFWMGAQSKDPNGPNYDRWAGEDEGPVHEVMLKPFLLGKYEVTQRQWAAVMGSNPSRFKGEDLPVEAISWEDIQGFEAKTGLALPTEAQWEYACRGGASTPIAGTGNIGDMGWFDGANYPPGTKPVGKKSPNGFGLYDMHGNVWEHCKDFYDKDFFSRPEAEDSDPVCAAPPPLPIPDQNAGTIDGNGGGRIVRGGSWSDEPGFCRSSFRSGPERGFVAGIDGFRVSYPAP